MLELYPPTQEVLNTKDRVTIDLIKDGQEFLEKFDINHDLLLDTVSIIYRYLRVSNKVPHNLYKFFIAAYYIVSRHPWAFPAHESKKKFCQRFGLQPSSLEYSVEKIVNALGYVKMLDEKNYPYFFDPKADLGFKIAKTVVKSKVQKVMMNFLLRGQPINSQILCEELVTNLIFDIKTFPEELLRQYYDLILDLIEEGLQDYREYVALQKKYFI